jgi:transmembrane sensor
MSTPATDSPEFARAEQAALWCMRLSEGKMTRAEQKEFSDWLDSNPAHGAAFDQAASSWAEVHAAAASPEFLPLRVEALESLQQRHRLRAARLTRWGWRRGTLAASLALLVLTAGAVWWAQWPTTYSTGLGERRVVITQDGSTVSLDAATEVTAQFTKGHRSFHLIRGRAKFDVTKDPLRQFTVAAADRVVVATGTAFSVELVNSQVRVILYEGHVSVMGPAPPVALSALTQPKIRSSVASARQDLTEGHQLVAAIDVASTQIAPIDRTQSLSWQSGQLEFVDEPLATVVERMNRYAGSRLAVGDAPAGALLITGVFTAGDTTAFVEGIAAAFPVQVDVRGDTTTLRLKPR